MKIFPVVHIQQNNVDVATREGSKALNLGADGIYLIDHKNGGHYMGPLFETFNNLADKSPDRYIGLNLLGLSPQSAMYALAKALSKSGNLLFAPSALWVDDMRDDWPISSAMETRDVNPDLRRVRLLGGVAFKYTDTFTDDPNMARYETVYLQDSVDVVTTSGSATGQAPSVEKIRAMKEVMGDKLLAVASGITAENIYNYEGIVDEILVGTSIETSPNSGIFDDDKLRELIRIAHSLAK